MSEGVQWSASEYCIDAEVWVMLELLGNIADILGGVEAGDFLKRIEGIMIAMLARALRW